MFGEIIQVSSEFYNNLYQPHQPLQIATNLQFFPFKSSRVLLCPDQEQVDTPQDFHSPWSLSIDEENGGILQAFPKTILKKAIDLLDKSSGYVFYIRLGKAVGIDVVF